MMFERLRLFFDRVTASGQIASLVFIGVFLIVFLWSLGDLLHPLLIIVVLAYLLNSLVDKLQQYKLFSHFKPKRLAAIVSAGFLVVFLVVLMAIIPFAIDQLGELISSIRDALRENKLESVLQNLIAYLPFAVSSEAVLDIKNLLAEFKNSQQLQALLNSGVLFTVSSAENILSWTVYGVIIPIAVYFLVIDKSQILGWLKRLLPRRIALTARIWARLNTKIGDYIRGKFIEILILVSICLGGFSILELNYAILLSLLVGLAAIVPILGLIAITIPVLIIAYLQWGFTETFWYLLAFYTLVQAIDGYLLIPLLFGEVIDLHPLAIIFGILLFGSWWGLWGVFFAIPLVVLIETILLLVPEEARRSSQQTTSHPT